MLKEDVVYKNIYISLPKTSSLWFSAENKVEHGGKKTENNWNVCNCALDAGENTKKNIS